jgi:ABC-2 type transport system permease protein
VAVLSEPLRASPFRRLSRAQYSALAAMRWSMFKNGLRSTKGAIELGARSIAYIFYFLLGLGLAIGFGVGSYALVAGDEWRVFPIVLWAIFVVWQVVPVTLASFQEQFDLGGLLRFPVGFGAFYFLHLIFGLVDVSTIIGGLCCLGVWVGITVASPGLFLWAALGLAAFAFFNVFLVRAIFAWIDRWMAQRRTREIVSALFFLGLLSLQFLNPAIRGEMSQKSQQTAVRWLQRLDLVQRWLPPGLVSRAVSNAAHHASSNSAKSLGILGIYVLAAGSVLGLRLRAEYRGENFGDAPSRQKEERHRGRWLLDGSGPIAAVIEKELRTLMRSLPLLYGIGAPLLMVFVLASLYRRSGSGGGHSLPMALLISLGYALVGFTQLFYNNLGAEGAGIQVLFLSPTPIRTVILAKNIFHGVLYIVDAALVCVLASLRLGAPTPIALAATGAWLLFALPVHLAVGDAFSIAMPYRMNLGRIGRQRGSQTSNVLSMLIQAGVLALGAGVFALCSLFGRLWIAVPIFLSLALIAIIVWMRILRYTDTMANRHRDSLIEALVKAE